MKSLSTPCSLSHRCCWNLNPSVLSLSYPHDWICGSQMVSCLNYQDFLLSSPFSCAWASRPSGALLLCSAAAIHRCPVPVGPSPAPQVHHTSFPSHSICQVPFPGFINSARERQQKKTNKKKPAFPETSLFIKSRL